MLEQIAAWTDIDNASSRPATRSDVGESLKLSRILAELF